MTDKTFSNLNSDGAQGADEQRSEAVQDGTASEQPQPATKRSAESGARVSGSAGKQDDTLQKADLEEAILYAKKYLEDLLSFFGLNTDVHATSEDDEVIELDIPSTHLNGFLIGNRGETVRALQFMISSALKNQGHKYTRVNVDVADYKKHRAERLLEKAEAWFREVRDSGEAKALEPMNPSDRRVIHQAAVDYGLSSESEGTGRDRHIVLKPAKE